MQVLANPSFESYVIGSLLADHTLYHDIRALVAPDDFYVERWRMVYSAIGDMIAQGVGVDYTTVADELDRRGELREIGGVGALTECIMAPSFLHGMDYARQIADYARLRRVVRNCTEAVQAAHSADHDTAIDKLTSVLTFVQNAVSELDRSDSNAIADIVMMTTDQIEARAAGGGLRSIACVG